MRRHGSSRRSLPELTERMLARLARGGIQGLVNWGPRLSPERSASASQIAGMVAIQTQAIFTIERHDRKFPTRVLFRRTPSLIEGFALVSVAGVSNTHGALYSYVRELARSHAARVFNTRPLSSDT